MIPRGFTGVDKFRIFVWWLLDSIPRSVRRAFPAVEGPLELIKGRLLRGTKLNINGSIFTPLDSDSVFILSPEYEDWMWSHLHLRKGDVFVDVGAHIGKYTVQLAKVVGDKGLVVAIEPHPENFQILQENIRLNALKNVIPLNLAAWSGEGRLRLFIGDRRDHHSLKRDFGRGSIVVKAAALDNVLSGLRLEKIDWIKIDVEGAELEVLKGLQDTLKRLDPR
jgi:FkbM family methyltransferase